MKRLFTLILTCVMALSLTSCGGEGAENAPESTGIFSSSRKAATSEGYLPTCIEQISEGGVVPEGHEAKKSAVDGTYPLESLWGSWVPENEEITTEQTIEIERLYQEGEGVIVSGSGFETEDGTYLFETEVPESDTYTLELEAFPSELEFVPWWQDVGTGINTMSSAFNFDFDSVSDDINDHDYSAKDYEETQLGAALHSLGLGLGTVCFDYNRSDSAPLRLFEGEYIITYAINGETLSIGLLDPGTEEETFDKANLTELNYQITYSGWKLTLSYGGESVTYVPAYFGSENVSDLYQNGVEQGYEPMEGILGITTRNSTGAVLLDLHEGYVSADCQFGEDGTMSISVPGKESYSFQYLVSSYTLTLISGDQVSVYSSYRTSKAATNASMGIYIVVDGQDVTLAGKTSFQDLLDVGFTTSLDINQTLVPCVPSDEIVLQKNEAAMTVKVINPWDSPVPLAECIVCYALVDDRTGTIGTPNETEIGSTPYSQIEQFYQAAYEKKADMLRYKANGGAGGLTSLSLEAFNWSKIELLDYRSENGEVIYHFENGMLASCELLRPELLYNGLQDNVDNDALANMDAATMTGVIEIRDSVMDQLKKAFVNAGIQVSINESTGEIDMDTNVLFGYDSTELSAEGQAYIDSFMGVYASVILDDSLKDVISEVRFEGHTDSSGSYDYNLDLSQKRADAVLNYCLSSDTTSMNRDQKERLNTIASAIGYSFADLVYDSEGNEDADASRRVAIKFYIDAGSDTKEISSGKQTVLTAADGLTANDFMLTAYGESYNALDDSGSSAAWYFHYDPAENESRENIVETARGIHIGDSASDLFAAYGNADTYAFDLENPFYSADDYRSAMLDECESYVIYCYNDEDALVFFLDDWNCVSWIVYYIA